MERIKAAPKIPEIAIKKIFNQISEEKIKIGQPIPTEMELSKILGISRGSLREALATMEYLGVIEGKGNRKIVSGDSNLTKKALSLLKMPNSKDKNMIFEIFEFRKELETFIVQLACQRADEKDISNIQKTITEVKNNPDIADVNISFHSSIFTASHNQFLSSIGELMIYIFESVRKRVCIFMPSRKKEILKEHIAILKALKSKNIEKARDCMLLHLNHTEEAIKKRGILSSEE